MGRGLAEDRVGYRWALRTGLGGRRVAWAVAISDPMGAYTGDSHRQSPRFQGNLDMVVGPERDTDLDLDPCVARLGDGPKRIVNRGDDCVGKVFGKWNLIVSIHLDMTDVTTHHSPGTHDLLSTVQRHVPRRRRSKSPSRGLNLSKY